MQWYKILPIAVLKFINKIYYAGRTEQETYFYIKNGERPPSVERFFQFKIQIIYSMNRVLHVEQVNIIINDK